MKILFPIALIFCRLFSAVDFAFAQTWIQATNAPNTNWVSVASSADGTVLVAIVGVFASPSTIQGPIYKSIDSGVTWVLQTNSPNLNWQSVASSANGSNFIAAAGSQSSSFAFHTGVYTSTNSGLSWISNNLPAVSWFGVASSADGSKLIAVAFGKIYTSTNFGANWSSNNIPFYLFYSCASSADGSKLIVGSGSGPINISTNSGMTWKKVFNTEGWPSIASSVDGSKLVAISSAPPNGPRIFISTDFGATWMSNSVSSSYYQYVASSADGVKLVLAVRGGGIYTSRNSGITWVSNNVPNEQWSSVASSADGNELIATVQGGGIWIFKTTPTPSLNISPSDTNLDLSWLVPSTNFALEQNLDLTTTNWVTLTNTPTLNFTNLQNQVTITPTNSSGYFRLISQ